MNRGRNPSIKAQTNNFCTVLEPLVHGVASATNLEIPKDAQRGGLGVITAAIFLAGEMAGSGVLALPFAMLGTGG